jgi:membrane associated rhomboid family serine protease
LTWLILGLITALSLSPLPELPPEAGGDKLHHFMAYAALVFPVALRKPRRWGLLALAFILYSGFVELVQPYVNRYGDWLDMEANTSGVICGLLAASLVNRLAPDSTI